MKTDPTVVVDRAAVPAVSGRPSWLALRARPEYAAKARRFVASVVSGHPFDAYESGLVAGELVTNAILRAAGLRRWPDDAHPIAVEVLATVRFVHLAVTDPDNRPISPADRGGLLAESGRGMAIVDQHAAVRWVAYADHTKTVHAVIPAAGVELTPAELAGLGVPA